VTEQKLATIGAELYENLEAETGLSTGFKRCGSIFVARNSDRMISLERLAAKSAAFGNEIEVISPEKCGEYWNGLLDTSKLVGGLWIPKDGSGSPTDLTMSLLAGAR
jgi:4-methylaminobutanoate oxidase (formaldehyde-forming)